MKEIQHAKGKIYYSMGEVAELFDVELSLIRFWESKFDLLKPHRNKKGNRLFTPRDVDHFKLIYHLVKERGMTLAGAEMRIRQNKAGAMRDVEIVERLQRIRATLAEIREELREDPEGAWVVAVKDEEEEPLEQKGQKKQEEQEEQLGGQGVELESGEEQALESEQESIPGQEPEPEPEATPEPEVIPEPEPAPIKQPEPATKTVPPIIEQTLF